MLSRLFARGRSLWRGMRRRPALDDEMGEEFRLHLELRAEDLVRRGYSPAKAARQARLEFGSMHHYKDVGAESRGLKTYDGIRVSWLDFKLGFRMLARYPGLTIIGGIAMTFGIAMGTVAFEVISQWIHPTMPLEAGDRIVAIRLWDPAASQSEPRVLRDFAVWTDELKSIRELSLYRSFSRNLIVGDALRGEPVLVAEMTASGFPVARVKPLLGRTFSEADARAGAEPVIVIGYDVWQSRLGGDDAILGGSIRLGASTYTVVGVMPKGYAFPMAHGAWIPFQLNPAAYPFGGGPPITRVFGRLAPSASIADAEAELRAVMERHASSGPASHGQLRGQVVPLARAGMDMTAAESWALESINVFLAALMALVCGNVALLMFARASSREGEIVVRTALGASRARIVTQLFAEALVLGGVALVVGLAVSNLVYGELIRVIAGSGGGQLSFWTRTTLSPRTIAYATVLTVFGAVIAGVLPALKITRGLDGHLRQAAAGGGSARFGGVWTALIVSQIAITVAFPVTAFLARRDGVQMETLNLGLPAREYLSARVSTDRDYVVASDADTSIDAFHRRFAATVVELQRRLSAQPGVSAVTFATLLPGMWHPRRRIEVDGEAAAAPDSLVGHRVSTASVAEDYFSVAMAPMIAGRAFGAADRLPDRRVVIVNESFVRRVLGGRNAIGRRVRYAAREPGEAARADTEQPGPWYEIVGVVKDLAMTNGSDPHDTMSGMYHALPAMVPAPVLIAIHVKGDPKAFAPAMRSVALALDPSLRLDRIQPLNEVQADELRNITFWVRALVGVSAMALLLSLAAIYAVMAFAVARRTREIGVRVALGSDRRRIVAAIFARPLRQVSLGIGFGTLLATTLIFLVFMDLTLAEAGWIAAYSSVMFAVCLLACVVPTRRALAIQPTEALRADG